MKTRGIIYTTTTSLMLVAGVGLNASVSHADVTDFDAFEDARQLSDAELDGMRGRFVAGNRIIAFGVSMTSKWSNSSEALNAGINFQATMGSDPSVTFNTHLTAVPLEDYQATQYAASSGSTITNLGTGNGYGIVQTIQAGGDGNGILNDLQINIHSGDLGGLSGGNGESALTTGSGAVLTTEQGKHGMQTRIMIPGHGAISQKILPNSGLHQSVKLQSSFQRIHNLTQLNIQVGPGANALSGQARQALESLRGLRR